MRRAAAMRPSIRASIAVRGQPGQIRVAERLTALLAGSEIRASHRDGDERVQDPYSLRCQPQVMGACLELLDAAAATLAREANGVSDNPLVFADDAARSFRAAISTASRSPSPPTRSRWRWPRPARCRSGGSRSDRSRI